MSLVHTTQKNHPVPDKLSQATLVHVVGVASQVTLGHYGCKIECASGFQVRPRVD